MQVEMVSTLRDALRAARSGLGAPEASPAPLRWVAVGGLNKDALVEGLLGALGGALPQDAVARIRGGRCA